MHQPPLLPITITITIITIITIIITTATAIATDCSAATALTTSMMMMMTEEDEGSSSKKRRLGVNQVRFLESSFKEEKKLEPERKAQIAQQLGLQPRQVAIWFQNRRARSRSKQLERDYIVLKSLYDVATLEKQKLQDEVLFSFLINLILVFHTKCTLELLQRHAD